MEGYGVFSCVSGGMMNNMEGDDLSAGIYPVFLNHEPLLTDNTEMNRWQWNSMNDKEERDYIE